MAQARYQQGLFDTPLLSEVPALDEKVEYVSVYTRAQAIEDGVLVDLSENFPDLTRGFGFKFPVACTAAVFSRYIQMTPAAEKMGCDINGRCWDVLWMLRLAIRLSSDGQLVNFSLLTQGNAPYESNEKRKRERGLKLAYLKSVCGPGDNAEPVITIMLPEED